MDNVLASELSLSQIQKRLSEMLYEFHEFCKTNHLRYFIAYGTLLGAVRHGGFIPWDDDIDVVMPRSDYERLLSFDSISNDCDIVSYKKDLGYYHPYAYCNIADKKTYMIEHSAQRSTKKGLFIDVFPLDGLPSSYNSALRYINTVTTLARIVSYSNQSAPRGVSPKSVVKRLIICITHMIGPYRAAALLEKLARRYDYDGSEFCAQMVLKAYPSEKELRKTSLFDDQVLLKFADYEVFGPIGYKDVLASCYGDYMKLPPVSQRNPHHNYAVHWR